MPEDPTVEQDDLLREAARLRGDLPDLPDLPGPEPTTRLDVPPAPAEPVRTRTFDPAAIVIGIWLVVAAALATTLEGAIVPITFAVMGLALLVPKQVRGR